MKLILYTLLSLLCVIVLSNLTLQQGVKFAGLYFSGPLLPQIKPARPVDLSTISNTTTTQIVSGQRRSMILTEDGRVFSWGYNSFSNLGLGPDANNKIYTPTQVKGLLVGQKVVHGAIGSYHALVVTSEGQMYAWGENFDKQLGDGTQNSRLVPVPVDMTLAPLNETFIVQVAAGLSHSYALGSNGKVYQWGGNADPKEVGGALMGKFVIQIHARNTFAVALTNEGRAYSWGMNTGGQLGDGTTTPRVDPVAVTVDGLLRNKNISKLATGEQQVMAITSDGEVVSWGLNLYGSLGEGTFQFSIVPRSVYTGGPLRGKTMIAVSVGRYFTVAVSSDGKLFAWGASSKGQLNYGGYDTQQILPIEVDMNGPLSGKKIVEVSCGDFVTIVKDSEGFLYSWGNDEFGQLGQNDDRTKLQLMKWQESHKVKSPSITSIGVSHQHSMVSTKGGLYAWGSSLNLHYGYILGSDTIFAEQSTEVEMNQTIIQVSTGYAFTMALTVDGSLFAFGANENGQLGDGTFTTRERPIQVDTSAVLNGSVITQVAAGFHHSVVLTDKSEIFHWGDFWPNTPTRVKGSLMTNKTIIQIASGNSFSLALSDDGQIYGWGQNWEGQLGPDLGFFAEPINVDKNGVLVNKTVVKIEAGSYHVLALTDEGEVFTFGAGWEGQLGHDNPKSLSSPTAVSVLHNKTIVQIAAGYSHSAALDSEGNVYTWGANSYGNLADESTTSSNSPVLIPIPGQNEILQIFAGGYSTMVLINHCNDGYYGKHCDQFTCAGILPQNASVCSHRGSCVGGNNCTCSGGYYGSNCEKFDCFSMNFNSSNVCSSHGLCLDVDNCSCSAPYYGSNCGHYDCFNISHTNSQVCSSHGSCIDFDTCHCADGYYGRRCEQFNCFSVNKNNASVCSSHGSCIDIDNCSCSHGFYGSNCEQFYCFDEKHNSSNTCSSHGSCIDFDKCTCFDGYYGVKCDQFDCFSVSHKSTQVCSGHGSCFDVNQCNCSNQFSGIDCSIPRCFQIPADNSSTCSGNGECRAPDSCACETDYFGAQCEHLRPVASVPANQSFTYCSDLILDGSLSYSPHNDGPLLYRWKALGANATLFNIILANQTACIATIPARMMEIGQIIQFQLIVTTQSGVPSQPITFGRQRSHDILSDLFINIGGPSMQTAFIAQSFALNGYTQFDSCVPFDKRSTLEYSWNQLNGLSAQGRASGPDLIFEPNAFQSVGSYEFEFKVTTSQSTLVLTQTVVVQVMMRDLVASIEGGDRSVAFESPMVLKASCFDPEKLDIRPVYSWECSLSSTGGQCPPSLYNALNSVNSAIVTIPPRAMTESNSYNFCITYNVASRSDSDCIIVQATSSLIPLVAFTSTPGFYISKEASPTISFRIRIQAQTSYTCHWLLNDSIISTSMVRNMMKNSLSLYSSGLIPGETYVLEVRCTDSQNRTGSSVTRFRANTAPHSGIIEVEPKSGVALDTEFQFLATGWIDSDEPLTYQWTLNSDEFNDSLFHFSASVEPSLKTKLPAGNFSLILTVRDRFGAQSQAVERITVSKPDTLLIDRVSDVVNEFDLVNNHGYHGLRNWMILSDIVVHVLRNDQPNSRRVASSSNNQSAMIERMVTVTESLFRDIVKEQGVDLSLFEQLSSNSLKYTPSQNEVNLLTQETIASLMSMTQITVAECKKMMINAMSSSPPSQIKFSNIVQNVVQMLNQLVFTDSASISVLLLDEIQTLVAHGLELNSNEIYGGFNDVRLFSSMFSSDLLIQTKLLASIPMQDHDQIGISSSDTVFLDQWKKNDEDIFVLSKILSKAHIPAILSSYQESINSTIVSAVAVSAQIYTTIEKTHINNVRITIPASIPIARRTMLQEQEQFEPRCTYFDNVSRTWIQDANVCALVQSSSHNVTCSCTVSTGDEPSFVMVTYDKLISSPPSPDSPNSAKTNSRATAIGLGVGLGLGIPLAIVLLLLMLVGAFLAFMLCARPTLTKSKAKTDTHDEMNNDTIIEMIVVQNNE